MENQDNPPKLVSTLSLEDINLEPEKAPKVSRKLDTNREGKWFRVVIRVKGRPYIQERRWVVKDGRRYLEIKRKGKAKGSQA